jgi:hypothetical protein
MVFLFFIIWRLVDLTFSFLAPKVIPYFGLFAHPETLLSFKLPKIIYAFANFDGVYYLKIAKDGYQQYEQAFFPLYPLLIRFFSVFFKNYLLAGLFISNLSFFLGLIIFLKYLKLVSTNFNKLQPILTILFLLLFPTSFFFGAVYTEGFFFLLVVSTFYFLAKKNYGWAGFTAFLAGLTRINGVLLIIPFFLELIKNFKKNKDLWLLGFVLTTPLLGLLTYMRFLLKTTGDALAFFHAQTVFGEGRTTKLILLPQVFYRYFKILFTAQPNFQYFISFFELTIFSFVFIILIFDLMKNLKLKIKNLSVISLNLFSLANILLPTFTGSFLSIPRFSLLSLSFFIFLGSIKNSSIKLGLMIIFFILHLLFLSFFLQGYFIS